MNKWCHFYKWKISTISADTVIVKYNKIKGNLFNKKIWLGTKNGQFLTDSSETRIEGKYGERAIVPMYCIGVKDFSWFFYLPVNFKLLFISELS